MKFDGYAHHPYSVLGAGPMQKARYPNVHLTQLKQFSKDLHKWFRKVPNIWITEYGFETKPGEPRGVSSSQQALYVNQSLNILRNIPTVKMLVWFILRDDPTSTWQSGSDQPQRHAEARVLVRSPPRQSFWTRATRSSGRSSTRLPIVRLSVLELAARNGSGTLIGADIKVFGPNSQFFGNIQMQSTIAKDGWASFTFAPNGTKRTYYLYFEIQDKNGNIDRAPGHARHRVGEPNPAAKCS